VDGIVLTVPLDPYLSLRALSAYSGLSVRKLREYLVHASTPLPCFRLGGKVLVRRSEFDAWIAGFRQRGRADLDEIVADALREL
jgi:hypothetical protein